MKSCCRRFCCMLFCCRCGNTSPLKSIDDDTRLLPINAKTKGILEKNELHCYGVIPDSLRGSVIDISKYTKSFVRKIVCGSNHCLILFNDGQLAGFGGNEDGQLGLDLLKNGNYVNEIKTNRFAIYDPLARVNITDYDIIDIAAGDNFSLVVVRANLRNILVRLGLRPEDKYRDDHASINPVNIVELNYDKINNIKNVYQFGQRSLVLTQDNNLYVGGVDFHLNPVDKFKHVDHFTKQIRSIQLGLEHCLILDFEGGLYAFGDNTYGELALENASTVEKPTRVTFNFNGGIKKVSVGARHTMILLENGDLYACGDNSEGQCSGFSTRYANPVKVDFDHREKIIDVYSGYNHNAIILNNGEMYTWGDTSSGKLGFLEGNFTQTSPKLIQVLKGKYANYIALGFQMTIISTGSYENSLHYKS